MARLKAQGFAWLSLGPPPQTSPMNTLTTLEIYCPLGIPEG